MFTQLHKLASPQVSMTWCAVVISVGTEGTEGNRLPASARDYTLGEAPTA
jgi:hypothetical protein